MDVSRNFKTKVEKGRPARKRPVFFPECGHTVNVYLFIKKNPYCPSCLDKIRRERERRKKQVLRWIGE